MVARTWGALASLVPTGVFLLVDRVSTVGAAMIGATVGSVIVILVRRRRNQPVGILLPVSLAYVVVRGIAGIMTDSPVVYFGAGLVLSAVLAVGVGATAFTRRPMAAHLLPAVTPYRALNVDDPRYRRVAAHVTAVWALAELSVTAWEANHLLSAPASEFLLTRTVVAWPIMAGVIFCLIFYVRLRLDPVEFHLRHA